MILFTYACLACASLLCGRLCWVLSLESMQFVLALLGIQPLEAFAPWLACVGATSFPICVCASGAPCSGFGFHLNA